MGDAVYITAQEAAERLLTIRIAGIILFSVIVLGGIWFLIMWKHGQDYRKIEVENAKDRIVVTKNIGVKMASALEKDGAWKEQYFILKSKYDVLEAHCENLEQLLESAEKGKFVPKGGNA